MERFHGSSVDYHLSLGETENARIFFTVHVEPGVQIPEVPYEELEAEVERLARTWDDDLRDAPDRASSAPSAARRSPTEYGAAVPRLLQVRTDWDLIVDDVLKLDELEQTGTRASSSGSATRRPASASRASSSTRPAARSTCPRSCRSSRRSGLRVGRRGAHRAARRRQGLHPRLRRAGLARRRARPRARSPTRCARTRSSRCGAARPRSDSLNRLVDRRRAHVGAGAASCARTGSTASASPRASPRSTATTRSRRTRSSRRSSSRTFEAKFDPIRSASPTRRSRRSAATPAWTCDTCPSLDQDQIIRHMLGTIQADRAHERLPPGPRVAVVQAPLGGRARDAEAVPAVRDLRVLAADGGDPSAGRHGCARRDPLVRPARRTTAPRCSG